MYFLGIDPGKEGGIAILHQDGRLLDAVRMPCSERDVLDVLRPFAGLRSDRGTTIARAMLERVSASPQMGVSSAFSFGRGYGGLLMALAAARIPFDQVVPRVWQPAMGVYYPGKAKHGTRDKNVAKRRAQQVFPYLTTITHAIADALLLAEYCRRYQLGQLPNRSSDGEKEKGGAAAVDGEAREAHAAARPRERGTAQGRAVASAAGDGPGAERAARSSVRGHRGGA